ncbi:MAG TPA: HEAT repeat domain-containing protein [Candidatus Angelobacter sp.]|nr:HEAT repeat domain-containing protein [Candidatus Angelobacter sp.]
MQTRLRYGLLLVVLCGLLAYAFSSGALQQILTLLSPAPSDSRRAGPIVPSLVMKKFSPEEIQEIDALAPQQQAERLLTAATDHYEGAPAMIMSRMGNWRGVLERNEAWNKILWDARNSSDLRVRAAAIEVYLMENNLDKSPVVADQLIDDAQNDPENRPYDLTMLGMLANRGTETTRIHGVLKGFTLDPDEQTRFWAIESLAYLGTVDTIPDFLEVLRLDASPKVRERCAASLADAGMFTREQRMNAVPGLIDVAGDAAQNADTRNWAFQALQEITVNNLGTDAEAWRKWFGEHGKDRTEEFRHIEPYNVGNH